MINKFAVLTLMSVIILTSCSKDDDELFVPSATDVITTIDEHPSNGTSIGTIATNLTGGLVYSFTSQSIPNALAINPTTGQITIGDATKFDFETNPTLQATATVTTAKIIFFLSCTRLTYFV